MVCTKFELLLPYSSYGTRDMSAALPNASAQSVIDGGDTDDD